MNDPDEEEEKNHEDEKVEDRTQTKIDRTMNYNDASFYMNRS